MFISLKSEVVSLIVEDANNDGFEMVHWGALGRIGGLEFWESSPEVLMQFFSWSFWLDILAVKASYGTCWRNWYLL